MSSQDSARSRAPKGGEERAPTWFRRLVFYSVTSGLASLVPIPFLDDRLVAETRRRMMREMARDRGLAVSEREVLHLSGTEPNRTIGCVAFVVKAAFKIGLKTLRTVYRTVLFVLAIKRAAEIASATFHEGFLAFHGLQNFSVDRVPVVLFERRRLEVSKQTPGKAPEANALPDVADEAIPEDVARLRRHIEAVCEAVDTRPIQRMLKETFWMSRRLARTTARRFVRVVPRLSERQEEQEIEARVPLGLVDRVVVGFSAQSAYLADLESRLVALVGAEEGSCDDAN